MHKAQPLSRGIEELGRDEHPNDCSETKAPCENNENGDTNELNGSRITVDWAKEGLAYALKKGDIVVIVDTLRFSSAVVTAIAHGFTIYPVPDRISGEELSRTIEAYLAVRSDRPGLSISPVSFVNASPDVNKNVILPSPNGASCSAMIKAEDSAFIGCMLNAQAVGEMISSLAHTQNRNVTIIACGEQRSVLTGERVVYMPEETHRVFAIEDYLGAGGIIASSSLKRSTEAEVCVRSFAAAEKDLLPLLHGCFSGRYLIEHDSIADIEHAAQMNLYNVVPAIHGGDIVWIE